MTRLDNFNPSPLTRRSNVAPRAPRQQGINVRPNAPGITPIGPQSEAANRLARLNQALGGAGQVVQALGQAAERSRSQLRGRGVQHAREDLPLLQQQIRDGELTVPDDVDIEAFTEQTLAEQTEGLPAPMAEGYRDFLAPMLNQAFVSQQQQLKEQTVEDAIVDLTASAAEAETSNDIESVISEAKEHGIEQSRIETEILIPAAEAAARGGANGRQTLETILGKLTTTEDGEVVDKYPLQNQRARALFRQSVQQNTQRRIDNATEPLVAQIDRALNNDNVARAEELIDQGTQDNLVDQGQLGVRRRLLQSRKRQIERENTNAQRQVVFTELQSQLVTDQPIADAVANTFEAARDAGVDESTAGAIIRDRLHEELGFLADSVGEMDEQTIRNRIEQIDQQLPGTAEDNAAIANAKENLSRNIEQRQQAAVERQIEQIKTADAANVFQQLADPSTPTNGANLRDREIEVNGRTVTIERQERLERAYRLFEATLDRDLPTGPAGQQTQEQVIQQLRDRFGSDAQDLTDEQVLQRAQQQRMAIKLDFLSRAREVADPQFEAFLQGHAPQYPAGTTSDDIPDAAVEAFNLYKRMRVQGAGLVQRHLNDDDLESRYQLASAIEQYDPGVGTKQALAIAGTVRQENLESGIGLNNEQITNLVEDSLPDNFQESQDVVDQVRRIATTFKRVNPRGSDQAKVEEAMKVVQDNFMPFNGFLLNKRGLSMENPEIQVAGKTLIDWYLSDPEHAELFDREDLTIHYNDLNDEVRIIHLNRATPVEETPVLSRRDFALIARRVDESQGILGQQRASMERRAGEISDVQRRAFLQQFTTGMLSSEDTMANLATQFGEEITPPLFVPPESTLDQQADQLPEEMRSIFEFIRNNRIEQAEEIDRELFETSDERVERVERILEEHRRSLLESAPNLLGNP